MLKKVIELELNNKNCNNEISTLLELINKIFKKDYIGTSKIYWEKNVNLLHRISRFNDEDYKMMHNLITPNCIELTTDLLNFYKKRDYDRNTFEYGVIHTNGIYDAYYDICIIRNKEITYIYAIYPDFEQSNTQKITNAIISEFLCNFKDLTYNFINNIPIISNSMLLNNKKILGYTPYSNPVKDFNILINILSGILNIHVPMPFQNTK